MNFYFVADSHMHWDCHSIEWIYCENRWALDTFIAFHQSETSDSVHNAHFSCDVDDNELLEIVKIDWVFDGDTRRYRLSLHGQTIYDPLNKIWSCSYMENKSEE